ncbi:MAG TPA: sortase [Candidatus Merdenecus merdavium]|nr:sortase [Candidatus Merdenecus merdavium]
MGKPNKFFILGTICILGGILLFSYNMLEDYQVGKRIDSVKERLQKENLDQVADREEEGPDYLKNPHMEMPVVVIDGKEYIGYVIIPSLGLELPVLSSWSYEDLKIAPGRYEGSVYLNNMILLAHNYQVHFGKLHQLEVGDIIRFKDMKDHTFDFSVEKKEELTSIQVEDMVSGDWDFTLFTCTLGGEARTTIRCKLIEKDENLR